MNLLFPHSIHHVLIIIFIFNLSTLSFIYSQVEEPNENSADTTVKRELSLNAYPYIYYTPETELAFGAGGILIFYTSQSPVTLPSKLVLGGYYSTKKQYKITLDPTFYFLDNNLFINLPLSYGYFVDRFYGIGPTSTDVGDENYTSRVYTATLFLQIPSYWFTSDRTGLILDFNYTEMVDKQTNQELVNNSVVGSNGGSSVGIGVQAVWDSRDNLFFPNEGKYSSLKFLSYPIGDFNFYMFELDIRHYSSFSKDHILAGQAYFNSAGGSIPFYKVPALGGQNRMRGYYFGRYRDNVYYTFQLEYRQYFWWRFGYVLFGGIGGVASSPDKLRIDEFQFSYGAGLRYLFNKDQKVNVRVDFGIGSNGSTGIYFGIEEAF